jgi:hypothetical protein
MAKAKKQTTTTKATSAPKKKATPQHSAIIKECVRYLQSVAAYVAGFEADTGEFEIAGAGGPLGDAALVNAERALIALSATRRGKKVLTVHEIKAMAAACETLMSVDAKGCVLYGVQKDFIESFARATVAYFEHAAEIAHQEGKHAQG